MQDAIMKGNGNSRYLKSVASFLSLYPTYEDFAQALMAGTLPIDLNGTNSAGWSQEGTPLNKASLLKDSTAALYGLGTDAVPDEVLRIAKTAIDGEQTARQNGDLWVKVIQQTLSAAAYQTDLTVDFSAYRRLDLYIDPTSQPTADLLLRINNSSSYKTGAVGSGKWTSTTQIATLSCASLSGPWRVTFLPRWDGQVYCQHYVINTSGMLDNGGLYAPASGETAATLNLICADTSATLPAGTKIWMYGLKK